MQMKPQVKYSTETYRLIVHTNAAQGPRITTSASFKMPHRHTLSQVNHVIDKVIDHTMLVTHWDSRQVALLALLFQLH